MIPKAYGKSDIKAELNYEPLISLPVNIHALAHRFGAEVFIAEDDLDEMEVFVLGNETGPTAMFQHYRGAPENETLIFVPYADREKYIVDVVHGLCRSPEVFGTRQTTVTYIEEPSSIARHVRPRDQLEQE